MLGHQKIGTGPTAVIVLNDWLCDTSTWSAAEPYLDRTRFTWVLTDLRGYGRSKAQRGQFTLQEASADVLALADALQLPQFAIVGHSMSTLIALHLAQEQSARISRAVVLTPPPLAGFKADDETLLSIRGLALGDDAKRTAWLRMRLGEQMAEGWVRFKVERWRAAVDPEAAASYAAMFARHGLPHPSLRIHVPVLAVTGEQDAPTMRRAAVKEQLAPICDQLSVSALADSGHYPMQEAPPLLVTIVERFLRADSEPPQARPELSSQ